MTQFWFFLYPLISKATPSNTIILRTQFTIITTICDIVFHHHLNANQHRANKTHSPGAVPLEASLTRNSTHCRAETEDKQGKVAFKSHPRDGDKSLRAIKPADRTIERNWRSQGSRPATYGALTVSKKRTLVGRQLIAVPINTLHVFICWRSESGKGLGRERDEAAINEGWGCTDLANREDKHTLCYCYSFVTARFGGNNGGKLMKFLEMARLRIRWNWNGWRSQKLGAVSRWQWRFHY